MITRETVEGWYAGTGVAVCDNLVRLHADVHVDAGRDHPHIEKIHGTLKEVVLGNLGLGEKTEIGHFCRYNEKPHLLGLYGEHRQLVFDGKFVKLNTSKYNIKPED